MMRFLRLFFPVSLLAVMAVAFWPSPAAAQSGDELLANDACRANPHSEDCICRDIHAFAMVPRWVDYSTTPPTAFSMDRDSSGGWVRNTSRTPPSWDTENGGWTFHDPNREVIEVQFRRRGEDVKETYMRDVDILKNEKYKAYCSLAYFRENIRRLWVFTLALAGGLVAISTAWAGVVYMQEAVSGETRSMARTIIIRAILGLVILAGVFLIWEGVSGWFLSGYDIWSAEPGFLEQF